MTIGRHPKGSPLGGRFAAHQHTEPDISLDYTPITNEGDTWLPFCDGCGEQSDQIEEAGSGTSLCPHCRDGEAAEPDDSDREDEVA